MEPEARGQFTIGAVSRRTVLSAHVLRAWERRYGVVIPTRTEGGDRLYSAADVQRLSLLARAAAAGHPISRLAALPPESLAALVEEGEAARPADGAASTRDADGMTSECLAAVEAMDGHRINAVLTQAVVTLGVAGFGEWIKVILRQVGELWEDGEICPAHEHLLSSNVQRVLGWLLLTVPVAAAAPGLVVSTPEGHRHELAALLAAVEAATAGWRVTYLGPDLSPDDIARSVRATGSMAVALSVVRRAGPQELVSTVERLRQRLPDGVPLLLGGAGVLAHRAVLESSGAIVLADYAALLSALRRVTERSATRAAGGLDEGVVS